MNETSRRLSLVGAVLWLLTSVVIALQHRLLPLFASEDWDAIGRVLPHAAFGYVMFDRVPSSLRYYQIVANGRVVPPAQVDHNASWGYQNARFQINALLLEDYLESTCKHAGRDFMALRFDRDLVHETEAKVSASHCKAGRLTMHRDGVP